MAAVPCVIGIVFYAQWLDKRYPDFVPRTLNADEVARCAGSAAAAG